MSEKTTIDVDYLVLVLGVVAAAQRLRRHMREDKRIDAVDLDMLCSEVDALESWSADFVRREGTP